MSSANSTGDPVATVVRTTRIIVVALLMGVLSFGGYLVFAGLGNQPQQPPLLAYIAAGFAGLMIPLSVVVPRLVTQNAVRQIAAGSWQPPGGSAGPVLDSDEGKLAAVYQTKTIIAGALLEGAAFFNLVAYMLAGQQFSLAVAAVLCIAMAMLFPRRDAVDNWLDTQQRAIRELR